MASGKRALPPRVASIDVSEVKWEGLKNVDLEVLGYVLASHLVIEHYIDNFLKVHVRPALNWDDARLQFSQKIALIARLSTFKPPFDLVPPIKHLNVIRNRFAHRLDLPLEMDDLKPITALLQAVAAGRGKQPSQPLEVLESFTFIVCAWFAGAISSYTTQGMEEARTARREASKES